MNKENNTAKIIAAVIDFMELKIFQTTSLLLVSIASLFLFLIGNKQSGDGYWFLVLMGISILNLIFIHSNSRKYQRIGKYLALIISICAIMLLLFSLIIYSFLFYT